MKTASLPSLRVDPELHQAAESVFAELVAMLLDAEERLGKPWMIRPDIRQKRMPT